MSQRELAAVLGLAKSTIADAERGARGVDVDVLARAAGVAGLRLGLLDDEGREVAGMATDAARDQGDRRYPAHLDTRHGDEDWWYDLHRYDRARPWWTFDRERQRRDGRRERSGTPADHHVPGPDDDPWERADARRRDRWRRVAEERQRRFLAGELRDVGGPEFVCTCPPGCAELDDGTRPRHVDGCACGCDVG